MSMHGRRYLESTIDTFIILCFKDQFMKKSGDSIYHGAVVIFTPSYPILILNASNVYFSKERIGKM